MTETATKRKKRRTEIARVNAALVYQRDKDKIEKVQNRKVIIV
jgi:hypothetical protein